MKNKSYYDILGVKKTATQEEIQNAYRQLIKKWHPDKFANATEDKKKEAEEMSRQINEAYETLKDPQTRKEYDSPHASFEGFGGHSGGGGFDFNPFEELFRKMNGTNVDGKKRRGSHAKITITLDDINDLFKPIKKKIRYNIKVGDYNKFCPVCQGSGMVYKSIGSMTMGNNCKACDGTGILMKTEQHECEFTINGIESNAYFDENTNELIFVHVEPYEGNVVSSNRNENGNLVVTVKVKLPEGFTMESSLDVAQVVEVPLLTAILGGELSIPLVNGKNAKFKIKEGTEDGSKIRFGGKGLPSRGHVGDMYAYIKVRMPNKLTDEERTILEQLKNHENFK